jgi:uncharacterized protein (DUF39 family)/NAD-dependent dihydropyrimidine dehydrogenase PreA subunit
MKKTIEQINYKIKKGKAKVVTADEMTKIVGEIGHKKAFEKIDVVTTGTFGAMCSSGVFFNFGHADPPIKMAKIYLNGVEAYTGLAAVDAYLGAGQLSENYGMDYGGAHVIESLVKGESVVLKASSYGTDCYPRKEIETEITLSDMNQAIMLNPRNTYQRYDAAVNSTGKTIYTYMGKLLPKLGNITYAGAGELSPINNDPEYETIGLGTKIFLAGGTGYIIGNGTQHNPKGGFGTLMIKGELKTMSSEFLRAAVFKKYGPSLYLGIGIPIPILNPEIAQKTGISDEEIFTEIIDYGNPLRDKPALKKVSYKELKSGSIFLKGKKVRASSISSLFMAGKVAETLKEKIEKGEFLLTSPVEKISKRTEYKNMKQQTPKEKFILKTYGKTGENYLNYNREKCIRCGVCISVCPFEVFGWGTRFDLTVEPDKCKKCGFCGDVCPVDAIKLNPDKE